MYAVIETQSEQKGGRVVGVTVFPASTFAEAMETRYRLIDRNDAFFGEVVYDTIDGERVHVHVGQATLITYVIREV
jgi:hypothetical protein